MYGMVNRALEHLVTERFGIATWVAVCDRAETGTRSFISNRIYPDAMTYRLVSATAQVTGHPLPQVLEWFGEHWVLKTASESYGDLLDAHGTTFERFILGLPNLHTRIALLMPDIRPPHFAVIQHGPREVEVHYSSERDGLLPFVVGLMRGLGQRFETAVNITIRQRREDGHPVDILHLTW